MKFDWRHFSRKPASWWDPAKPGPFEDSQLAWVRDRISGQRPDFVLEIGVGRGRASPWIRGQWKYVGLEVNRSLLVKAEHNGNSVLVGSGTQLPFRDGSFDAVAAFDVLMHIYERDEFLSECRRVLRPGGILIFNFLRRYSRGWRHYLIAFGLHPKRLWSARDRRYDTVRAFLRQLRAHGFRAEVSMSETSVPLVFARVISA